MDLSRFATPEVAIVVATIATLWIATRVIGWAYRAVASVVRRIPLFMVIASTLLIGGGSLAGHGLGEWVRWAWLPSENSASHDVLTLIRASSTAAEAEVARMAFTYLDKHPPDRPASSQDDHGIITGLTQVGAGGAAVALSAILFLRGVFTNGGDDEDDEDD